MGSGTAEPSRARSERLSSAGLRAVSGQTGAEIRGNRLEVDHRPQAIAVPYLALNLADAPLARRRGVTDALALRIRYSDRRLHLELSPEPILERVIFDIAEQLRCESRADPTLSGIRANISAAFDHWSEQARAERINETRIGLLVFTITHMMRYRLLGIATTEIVDDVIEEARGDLGRLVGHALKELPNARHSQIDFAEPAGEISRLIGEMVADAEESADASPESVVRNRLLIPIDWDTLDAELAAAGGGPSDPTADLEYHVFTRAHDIEILGVDLYRPAVLQELRRDLDRRIADQAVSVTRLAQHLQQLFPSWAPEGWTHDEEDGPLDPSRLTRVVIDPADKRIRRLPCDRPAGDAVVSFLIDTSGSMKVQRYETVTVLVDTLARALELAGVATEVLGFTTASWAGGRPFQEWRAAGSRPRPGRLAEVQHIVYSSADQTWRQSRLSMAAMLRTDHYREGVDGEAIEWAASRLMGRSERRRALVLISDGAPMEAATANANGDELLADHLRWVVRAIENSPGDGLAIGAVSIADQLGPEVGHTIDEAFTRSIPVDLSANLRIGDYDILHRLFGPTRRSG
ncbi:MAG: hypothetical protein GY724_06115 [Actinomycetia bacterium]|nr:hypothetical protein [Actinomycetes bacterium]